MDSLAVTVLQKKSPAFLSHFLYVLPLRTLAQRCLLLGVEAGSGCVPRLQRPPSAPLPLRLKDGVCVRKSIHSQCKVMRYLSQYPDKINEGLFCTSAINALYGNPKSCCSGGGPIWGLGRYELGDVLSVRMGSSVAYVS